jgi:uncharacterized protein YjbI with pentapeptide repeats
MGASLMSNEEHLVILKKGIYTWNKWRIANPDIIPDFSKADLRRYDFGVLTDEEYETCNSLLLENPDLRGMPRNLSYVDFSRANLEHTNFEGVDCYRSIFYGANLKNAAFDEINLEEANFEDAYLEDTNFVNSNLHKANLRNARINAYLSGVNLVEADLRCVKFISSYLENVNLSGANIEGVDFGYARFENTIMPDGTIYTSNDE